MTVNLSSESANWISPVESETFTSTLPTYVDELPLRVNREGVRNYIKNRGSLNLGDWAMEGRRTATPRTQQIAENNVQAKVIGPEAFKNYLRGVSSTPNLLHGVVDGPRPHHGMRVKREGRANYIKDHQSRVKSLLDDYGKHPLPSQTRPHTQGELATNIYYSHQGSRMNDLLSSSTHFPLSPKPVPHVKGVPAHINLEKGLGDSQILEHKTNHPIRKPDPFVKGPVALENYCHGQKGRVNKLFYEYGKLPLSSRTVPKVKFDGVENFVKAQGNAMRQTITQCPPPPRFRERPQSAVV